MPECLVWQAPSLIMNPTIPQDVIDEAYDGTRPPRRRNPARIPEDIETSCRLRPSPPSSFPARMLPAVTGVEYIAFTDRRGGSQTR